jgi:AcrR family transcriptional regulator
MDQRIIKTKKLLKETLIALMEEKDFHLISVKELTHRAKMNRGTFYLHFQSVEQMLESFENELINNLSNIIDQYKTTSPHGDLKPMLLKVTTYLQQDCDFCRALVGIHGDINFIDKLKQTLIKEARKGVLYLEPKYDDQFIQLLLVYIVSGGLGIIQEWFKTSCQTPIMDIIIPCEKMIIGGMSQL